MPHLDYLPGEMGRAEIEPKGAFEAGSYQSFTLTYTAGKFGIDDTGSIKIGFRQQSDTAPLQLADPAAPNYVSVEASNNAVLKVAFDPKLNIRPWGRVLHIRVQRGYLRAGDRIVVRYGDRRFGSPGLRLQTFCERRFTFKVFVDAFATYEFTELPQSPEIAIVPGPPVTWRAVLPTLRRAGEGFRLAIKAEDLWGNPSDRVDTTVRIRANRKVDGLPASATLRPGEFARVIDGLAVREPGEVQIELVSASGERLARANPLRVVAAAELRPYWADMHGQSGETVGTNPARDYFAFGRDRAFLDVIGHQGNDFQITPEVWAELERLSAEFDAPGRFVTLPGYEWSGNTGMGGDRNVYFACEGRAIRRSSHALVADRADAAADCHTARELHAALVRHDPDAIVVPHVGGRYADIAVAHEPRLEHSVEVHSAWGTFEWMLTDALALGYRVGVVCNSDGHKGRPGASYAGAGEFGAIGGLTCLLMPELSRAAVFECLRRRHHYGTTGARLILDVRARFDRPAALFDRNPALPGACSRPVGEAMMGDILRTEDGEAALAVDLVGSAPIERVELRNGGETLEVVRPFGEAQLGRRVRVIWEGAEYRGRGRQTTWDGRASLIGNRILRASPVNFLNAEKRLAVEGPTALSWRSVTTGNLAGFDLWLEEPRAGELVIATPHASVRLAVEEIGIEDRVFEAGGLGRRLRVFRLPEENAAHALRIERRLRLRAGADNALYVALTQEDGHRAWSSPIYLVP
ncbi:MAG: DUF3604 domain-containing protein [Proteobacteria bacterium]|nr:DUF3604 domain-containing protein [Pseudomonadota bacterium]